LRRLTAPDVVVEFFVFDQPGKAEHQHETARDLLHP